MPEAVVGLTWLVFGLVVLVDVLIDDWNIWRVNVDAGRNLETNLGQNLTWRVTLTPQSTCCYQIFGQTYDENLA